jgi:WhiB family redox-sensing transcriptional regulator
LAEVTWKSFGACVGHSDVDFFPDSKAGRHASAAAKSLCARCYVRAQCLDEALAYDEAGIWGGTTETERRAIKARYIRVKGPKALARTIFDL